MKLFLRVTATVTFLALALVLVFTAQAQSGRSNRPTRGELLAQVNRVFDEYRGKLDELAAWCASRDLNEAAARVKGWSCPRAADKLYITVLSDKIAETETTANKVTVETTATETTTPSSANIADIPPRPAESIDTTETSDSESQNTQQWQQRFVALRRQQADTLFKLARRAADQRRPSLAFDLVLACLHEDPDHEAARNILGYHKFQDHWRTLFEISRIRAGWTKSKNFGWVRKADLARWENGERPRGNRWISAEEDALLHRDIRNGWLVETEHYTIRTNHSVEAAAALGERLEQLYNVWKRLFIRYYATQAQVMGLFEGKSRGRPIKLPRHKIVYFCSRDDYNAALQNAFPNISISTGVYVESTRRAYFFAGPGYSERTLLHEATHQLFHESRPVAENVGRNANFWIVEGIATYMESLREEEGHFVLGGFDDVRMKAARYRLLNDGFYVPLAELSTYGMQHIQTDPRVATLYSQMAGLTHFLVHADNGQYRDALVAYLRAVYSGNQNPNIMTELTGCSFDELDSRYHEYISKGPSRTKSKVGSQ